MRSDCMRHFLPSLIGLMLSVILVDGVLSRTNNSVTSSADGSLTSSGVVGNNNGHRRFSVSNYDDAVKYLRKYGYLRCIVASPRVRRQASSFMSEVILREDTPTYGSGTGQTSPSSTGNAGSPRRRCNRADVSHALKVMQTHFRLPVTGHVDVSTKQTMNKGRCGNADVPPKSQMANHINDHNDPEVTSTSRHRKNTSAQSHHAAHHHHHQHNHHHTNSGAGESGDRPFRRFIRHAFVGTTGSGDGVASGHRIRHGQDQRHVHNRLLNREGREDVLSDISSSGSERHFNDVVGPEGSGGHLHLPLQHDDREETVDEQSTNVGDDAVQSSDLSRQPLMPTASLPLGLTVIELPTTKTIVENKLRRQSMLAEIKTRLNSSPLSTTSNADGRLPKDKMALAAELKQTRRRRREALRRRNKRSVRAVSIDQVVIEGSVPAGSLGSGSTATRLQTDSTVRWRLLDDGIGSKIPLIHQKSALELSFRMWSEVTPVKFVEDRTSHVNDVDILIAFGKQQHLNCDKSFDGSGGELAHSWAAGDIHFDDDENYRLDISDEKPMTPPPTTTTANVPVTSTPQADAAQSISLQKLALHEIGHVLGLIHNYDRQQSIMYPIYVTPNTHEDFELQRDDRRAVQQIYGVCKGSFDLTFDWLRKSSYNSDVPGTAGTGNGQDTTTPTPSGAGSSTNSQRQATFFYNTYFFRGERFWMYENRDNRTRYGDPVYIDRDWHGLPGNLDGFTQVISKSGQLDYNIDTYFFKGDLYYKYDDSSHRVAVGYPRRIADDFGSNGQQQQLGIPNNIDAVWFDMNDGMLYFFKGEWVWTFDPRDIGRNSCCAQPKRRFSEVFPMLDRDDPDPLTGHVTTVFYSFHRRTVFMFRGEQVYELVSSAAMAASSSSSNPTSSSSSLWAGIRRLRPWYEIWYDICDVE